MRRSRIIRPKESLVILYKSFNTLCRALQDPLPRITRLILAKTMKNKIEDYRSLLICECRRSMYSNPQQRCHSTRRCPLQKNLGNNTKPMKELAEKETKWLRRHKISVHKPAVESGGGGVRNTATVPPPYFPDNLCNL